MKIYLASPLGFSPALAAYRKAITAHLELAGHFVIDPWEQDYSHSFTHMAQLYGYQDRLEYGKFLATRIGARNQELLVEADTVLGVLDGPEPDSGTVSEIAYAAGLGRKVYGLRTDMRDAGDFLGPALNLQVEFWIANSGGKLFRKISEIVL